MPPPRRSSCCAACQPPCGCRRPSATRRSCPPTWSIAICRPRATRDAIPGGEPELIVRFDAPAGEHLVVCRAAPMACTAPISTGDWRVAFRFDAGELVLDPVAGAAGGTPPAGVLGRHPLVFP